MTWNSADEPPDNSRTVLVMKKSSSRGAITLAIDFRHDGQWFNANRYGYEVLRWMESPAFED